MADFDPKKVVSIQITAIDSDGKRWELTPNDQQQEINDLFYPEDPLTPFEGDFDFRGWYKIVGPFTMPKEDFPGGAIPEK